MTQKEKNTENALHLFRMMESCYTYGGIETNSYNYTRYILPYKQDLGEKLFNELYEQFSKKLSEYKVIYNTYTDLEGCTYNTLQKI